jgi:acyl-coenzyme A thioesterase PaaI-like protein
MTESKTHDAIDPVLVGTPISIDDGQAVVELEAIGQMAADHRGLVHGGFIFGLADYAAMLAVNDPFVVLGAAQTTFTKPVRVGDVIRATARISDEKGARRAVAVSVARGDELVMEGTFTCFVLDSHVLDKKSRGSAS